MLNKFFSKCFNRRSAPLEAWSESDFDLPDNPPDELLCNEDTILCELRIVAWMSQNLVVQTGFEFSAKMFMYTAVSIIPSVAQLFNLSIRSGRVPRDWKLSVCCTYWGGLIHLTTISLLSVLSKMLEKHIHTLIYSHLK